MYHGLDNEKQVFFYEHEFSPLSNFSAYQLSWKGQLWMTSEHVYQAEKFEDEILRQEIRSKLSAHEAYRLGRAHPEMIRTNWLEINVEVMRQILRAKTEQHEYVRQKLLETGTREIIENSWKDDFWGWGINKDGKNMLGKLWMELREELRNS